MKRFLVSCCVLISLSTSAWSRELDGSTRAAISGTLDELISDLDRRGRSHGKLAKELRKVKLKDATLVGDTAGQSAMHGALGPWTMALRIFGCQGEDYHAFARAMRVSIATAPVTVPLGLLGMAGGAAVGAIVGSARKALGRTPSYLHVKKMREMLIDIRSTIRNLDKRIFLAQEQGHANIAYDIIDQRLGSVLKTSNVDEKLWFKELSSDELDFLGRGCDQPVILRSVILKILTVLQQNHGITIQNVKNFHAAICDGEDSHRAGLLTLVMVYFLAKNIDQFDLGQLIKLVQSV